MDKNKEKYYAKTMRITPVSGVFTDGSVITISVTADATAYNGKTLTGDYTSAPVTIEPPVVHISASVSGGELTWSAALPDSGEALTVIAASYDESGRMINVSVKQITADGAVENDTIAVPEAADEHQLMIVDGGDLVPICPAWDNGAGD